MRQGNPPRETMFHQIVVGVVVSVATTVLLKGLNLAETSPPTAKATAPATTSVRIAFAAPEPVAEPNCPPLQLFDCRGTSADAVLGFLPESLRLQGHD